MVTHRLGNIERICIIIGFQTIIVSMIAHICIVNQFDECECMLYGGWEWVFSIHLITAQIKPSVSFQAKFALTFFTDKGDEFWSTERNVFGIPYAFSSQQIELTACCRIITLLCLSLGQQQISLSRTETEHITGRVIGVEISCTVIDFLIRPTAIGDIIFIGDISSYAPVIIIVETEQMITDGIGGRISIFATITVGPVRIHINRVTEARTAVREYHLRTLSADRISFRPVAQVEQTVIHSQGFAGIVGCLAPVLHKGGHTTTEDIDS